MKTGVLDPHSFHLNYKLVWPTLIIVFSVTNEPVWFEEITVEAQYLMNNTNYFRRTFRIYHKLIKKNRKMSTSN